MSQSLFDYIWLCLAAFLAGGINALAGGGTLLTFPTLSGVLSQIHGPAVADVLANGTSTVALVPASLGSSWGFRREIYVLRHLLLWLLPPSLLGGVIGAWLLVRFPEQFSALVPWLILTAAVLFTLQPQVSRWLARRRGEAIHAAGSIAHGREAIGSLKPSGPHPGPLPQGEGALREAVSSHVSATALAGMVVLQFFISIYGGYFGAGIGILMLSGLGVMGLTDMHQMNGVKSVLGTAINSVAVMIFIATGNVHWSYALAMMATSLVGGFLAAHYSRRVSSKYVRWLVVLIGFALAGWYFAKNYWA